MMLSTSDVASICRVTTATVRTWILKNRLTVHLIGGRYVIVASREQLDALANQARSHQRPKANVKTANVAELRGQGLSWRQIQAKTGWSVRTLRRAAGRP